MEQAERERAWAVVTAHAEGASIREVAAAAGLSPSRVHQLVTGAGLDVLDAALGQLRAAGWPAPEDPDGDDDAGLCGRALIADRLADEVGWLRQCAAWLTHLHTKDYPPAVNLRPAGDWPSTAHVIAGLPRVAAILERVAADVGELARARRVDDLDAAAIRPGRRAGQRRRAGEAGLGFREFFTRKMLPVSSTLQLERAWDAWQTERHRRGETGQPAGYPGNPIRAR